MFPGEPISASSAGYPGDYGPIKRPRHPPRRRRLRAKSISSSSISRRSRACRLSPPAAVAPSSRSSSSTTISARRAARRSASTSRSWPSCNKQHPGQDRLRHARFPARSRVQFARGRTPGGVRGRGRRPARPRKGPGRRDGGLAVRQPAVSDTSLVSRAPRPWRESTDFDARYPQTLELVRGDIGQGLQLAVQRHPDVFHERHPAAQPARRVFRSRRAVWS